MVRFTASLACFPLNPARFEVSLSNARPHLLQGFVCISEGGDLFLFCCLLFSRLKGCFLVLPFEVLTAITDSRLILIPKM